MNITGTIELYCTSKSWMVDFTRATNATALIDAFSGCALIPLPYTPAMPGPAVRSAVRAAYPFAQVIIREDSRF